MSSPMPMLHLYRNILKAAKYFPSKKRDRIILGIKAEFREKKVGIACGPSMPGRHTSVAQIISGYCYCYSSSCLNP